ncbi:hypothetical protein FJY93_03070 [Candidatus Kaiserbacteria bacterium]|nr:hypothetical protein [Candidatus Kaiserbacteria bacterium]
MVSEKLPDHFMIGEIQVDRIAHHDLEAWHFAVDRLGLKGIDIFTGPRPSIGGIRWINGTSRDQAFTTVSGLALAMAEKSAQAGLPLDGVKMFVYAGEKSPDALRRVGEFIEFWQGRHIASVDMGTKLADMQIVRETTQYVSTVNPSPYTARGVASAMRTCTKLYGTKPSDLRVFVSGVCGEVGFSLAQELIRDGMQVLGNDITQDEDRIAAVKGLGVEFFSESRLPLPEEKVHVYAPCAGGGVLNRTTIPLLRQAGIWLVNGSANCQLAAGRSSAEHMHILGIDWAKDDVTNRGGLLAVAHEFSLVTDMEGKINETGQIVFDLIELSHELDRPVSDVAREYFAKHIKDAA